MDVKNVIENLLMFWIKLISSLHYMNKYRFLFSLANLQQHHHHQQHSLLSQASWGKLKMKPKET